MKVYQESLNLTKTVLRMSKDYTSFFYFTLESNENNCFYSTLPFEKGQSYRDILVYCTPELDEAFQQILKHCQKKQKITILEKSLVSDLV